VPGVGVDTESFSNIQVNRDEIRDSLGIPRDAIIAMAMGDIVPRKNYQVAIKAVATSKRPNLHYIICGKGPQIDILKKQAENFGVGNNIHFLGYRNDIKQLALSSDLFLFSSTREGLPRSTMEAMCAGLPCIISAIRGHVDLIENNKGGLLCPVNDVSAYAIALQKFVDNPDYRKEQGLIAKQRIKQFDYKVVKQRLSEIYDDILKDK
jgi:glycosyltransferase involved in cell wall biosynthesis